MYLPNISREIFLRSWHCFFRISVNINLYTYLFRNLHLPANRSTPLTPPNFKVSSPQKFPRKHFKICHILCTMHENTQYLLFAFFSFHFVFWCISLDFFVEQKLRKWKDWCTFVHTSHVYLSNVIFDMATTKCLKNLIEVKVLWLTELNFAIRNVLFQFNKSFHIAQWRKNSQIQSIFSLSWLSQTCTN